ncbi:4626_t:CDS:1, partial [Racocetra fulgida]
IEDWTCVNLTNYYQEKREKKKGRKYLITSKKDLGKVLNPDFEFDMLRKEKAQEILETWKVMY